MIGLISIEDPIERLIALAARAQVKRQKQRKAPSSRSGSLFATGVSGGGSTVKRSVYVLDIDDTLAGTLDPLDDFTIGGPGSGADVELTYGTGPDLASWPSDLVERGGEILFEINGLGDFPFLPGGAPQTIANAGSGEPRTLLTVTKHASGGAIPYSDGEFVGRMKLTIKQ